MKKISFVLCSMFFIILFSSCYQPVFYNIRKEVSLEKSTVTGLINSIARYTYEDKEYLVTQNGKNVYYKLLDQQREGDESAWSARDNNSFISLSYDYYNAEYKGEQIIDLVSDEQNIYILTIVMEVNHDEGKANIKAKRLYCTNSLKENTWTQISFPSISVLNSDIFCTNAVSKDGRKAYFRNDYDLYELNGATVPTDKISAQIIGGGSIVRSAVWFNDNSYFFGTIASTTNESLQGGDATMMYYGTSDGICYSANGNDFTTVKIPSVGTISCMTVTKDYLLYGQGNNLSSTSAGGGIYKVSLDSNGIPGELANFNTNADAVFTSSYQLITLLAVDSAKKEEEGLIYASTNFKSAGGSISVSYDNLGLWAYYPTRGNWNRE